MEYAFDENDPQGMGAIAMGSDGRLWAGTGEPNPGGGSITFPGNGVYRSDDRGESWMLVLPPETPFTGGIDLAIDPCNPDRIYAAMWDHRRQPHLRTDAGVGSGVFRSDDGEMTTHRSVGQRHLLRLLPVRELRAPL